MSVDFLVAELVASTHLWQPIAVSISTTCSVILPFPFDNTVTELIMVKCFDIYLLLLMLLLMNYLSLFIITARDISIKYDIIITIYLYIT